MKRKSDLLLLFSAVVCVAAIVVFSVPDWIGWEDKTLTRLVSETVPRIATGAFLTLLMLRAGYKDAFSVPRGAFRFVWAIPCFSVAVVNFPFSALLGGVASIDRPDLLWLFLLKCLSIAYMEELFFRGLLVPFLRQRFLAGKYAKDGTLISVLVSSALFALMHLVNLFLGAGIGSTLLQVGYTFLIGCMLAVVLLETRDLWLCVLLHAVFDVGGAIVTDLGSGAFQDTIFWILTAVAGMVCAAHIIWSLAHRIREERKNLS